MKKFTRKMKHLLEMILIVVVTFVANTSTERIFTSVSNDANNRVINLTTMALKLEEDIRNDLYSAKDTYTGDVTGYGADCPLCSGNLACSRYYVKDGTTIYPDEVYGNVRIVASSSNLPCGSIVRFNLDKISSEPIIAIVLDRGVLGNDLDLLMPSEEEANRVVGRNALTYDVLRVGWTR